MKNSDTNMELTREEDPCHISKKNAKDSHGA